MVFEHRNYLGLLGIAILVVSFGNAIVSQSGKTLLKAIPIVFAFMALSVSTYSRSVEWGDEVTFNALAVDNYPNSLRANVNMAVLLSNRNKYKDALFFVEKAIEINPSKTSLRMLGLSIKCAHNVVSTSDIRNVQHHLRTGELDLNIIGAMREMLEQQNDGVCNLSANDAAKMVRYAVENSNKKMPDHSKSILLDIGAKVNRSMGRNNEALIDIDAALSFLPEDPHLLIEKTEILILLNDYDKATETINQLSTISKTKLDAYRETIFSLRKKITIDNATADY